MYKLRKIFWEGEKIESELILSKKPISFLGDVKSGYVVADDSDVVGEKISGRIFAFPEGRGSTVGTYVMLQLSKEGLAPIAIVNRRTESIIAAGAVISGIALFNSPSPDLFELEPGIYRAEIEDRGEFAVMRVKK